MVGDWTSCDLGEFLTLQRGFDLSTQKRKPGNVPIVSSSGVSGRHDEAKARGPGVVTGRYGTVGQVFYITHDFWPLNTTLWVKDFKGNHPRFAYYLLQTLNYRSCSDKSSVPGVNRNDLHRIKVKRPGLDEQRAIAHILGKLDDKIELNRRTNETLEGMARAIFKSWFVDFDPVRRNMEKSVSPDRSRTSTDYPRTSTDRSRTFTDRSRTSTDYPRTSTDRSGVAADHLGGSTDRPGTSPADPGVSANDPEKAPETAKPAKNPEFDPFFPDSFEDSELGKIPKGWKVCSLPEVFEINPTRSLSKGVLAPYLDMSNMPTQGPSPVSWVMREMGSGMKFVNGDTLVARITPCLENGKTAFVDFLADGEVGWGSTEYIVLRPMGAIPPIFTYLLARTDDFRTFAIQQMTGSSGRQRVPADSLDKYRIFTPKMDSPIFRHFGELVSPMFGRIKAAMEQSRTLAALRDALLPKLLSGEIRVADAEKIVEGVA